MGRTRGTHVQRPRGFCARGPTVASEPSPAPPRCPADEELWIWGRNQHGQLGLGHEKHVSRPQRLPVPGTVTAVALGSGHSAAVISMSREGWGWAGLAVRSTVQCVCLTEPSFCCTLSRPKGALDQGE